MSGFSSFELTKSWRNADQFPTYEEDETKVRDDMQCLFDELAAGLTKLIQELGSKGAEGTASGASNIGLSELTMLPGYTNVQDAIGGILLAMQDIQAGAVLPGSVTSVELAEGAVEPSNIAAGAVTGPKLAAGAVTGPKCDFSDGLSVPGVFSPSGTIVLSANSYGDTLPSTAEAGRLFFKRVT